MPRFLGLSGTQDRENLDAPGLTPNGLSDPESEALGPNGNRTNRVQLYPRGQGRVMIANRVDANYQPGSSFANSDPQKGGVPGNPNGSGGISSESPSGLTTMAGIPVSPIKRSYGWADWQADTPQWPGLHQIINRNANPNRPQVNPTPFNTEGPSANTRYTAPSPWAGGTFIG